MFSVPCAFVHGNLYNWYSDIWTNGQWKKGVPKNKYVGIYLHVDIYFIEIKSLASVQVKKTPYRYRYIGIFKGTVSRELKVLSNEK